MTVHLTTPVLGKDVGDPYTGPLESWLLHEGYATVASTVPDAWGTDNDGILGAKAPSVTVTPTAATLAGATNAVNLTASGNVVFGTVGGASTTVALASGDTPAQAATKIDTALAGLADASVVSSKLNVVSAATGPTAYVTVVSGDATVLANLGLSVDQSAHGGDGRPTGASNTGVTADTPANDPTDNENREPGYWPLTPDLNTTIANDAENLTKNVYPAPVNFDVDEGGVDNDPPDALPTIVLTPATAPHNVATVVTITEPDNNLVGVTAVSFGGVAGTSLDVSEAENGTIKVTTPTSHAAGTVDVVLTDASGNRTLTAAFVLS